MKKMKIMKKNKEKKIKQYLKFFCFNFFKEIFVYFELILNLL